MAETMEKIIAIEWDMFDQVQNYGGRASCQDDKDTFYVMRSSQFAVWSDEMQERYYGDLQAAQREGSNLLYEKYAYMMERTAPDEYIQIKDKLPRRTPEKDAPIGWICGAHTAWLDALAEEYPRLTGRGRDIHKSEDRGDNTSFETYLWGELATYSVETLQLYRNYVAGLQGEGHNLNAMILQNTVVQYGYASMEEAEKRTRTSRTG